MEKKILYAVIGVAGCTVIAKVSCFYGVMRQSLRMAKSENYHDRVMEAAKDVLIHWEKLKNS